MARVSKVCHSVECAGTKQPVRVTMAPQGDRVDYEATCETCETVHPADTTLLVSDAQRWAQETKAANGGAIPLPLPQE